MNTDTSSDASGKQSILLRFYRGLREEINSPFNEWVTGQVVGHTPTHEEKLIHFVTNGGQSDYRKKFMEQHPGVLQQVA